MRKSKSKTGKSDDDGSMDEVEKDEESPQQEENGDADNVKTDSSVETEDEKQETEDTPPPKDPPKKRESRAKKTATAAESDEEYEVEEVLDSKKIKGKTHFLIRWKGYGSESDTWEPQNTVKCPELIAKFKEQVKNGKAKGVAKKRKSTTKVGSKKSAKSPRQKLKTRLDEDDDDDEEKEYEVEKILEVHHKKNGKREFLIHWKGWSSKHDTWEPEEHLNCSDLISRFMTKVKEKKNVEQKDLRVAPKSTNRFTLNSKDSGRRLSKRRGNAQRVRYDDAE